MNEQTALKARFLRLLILVCCVLFVPDAFARTEAVDSDFSKFMSYSTEFLLRKASEYEKSVKTDSVLLCYTVIVNKFDRQEELKPAEKDCCCEALSKMGSLYASHYYDYPKAYSCLLKARDIAEENHLDKRLPFIYGKIAGLYEVCELIGKTTSGKQSTLAMYKKTVHAARKVKDWEVFSSAMDNLVNYAYGMHIMDSISSEVDAYLTTHFPATVRSDYIRAHCLTLAAADRGDYAAALHGTDNMESCVAKFPKSNDGYRQRCLFTIDSYRIFFMSMQGTLLARDRQRGIECLDRLVALADSTVTKDFIHAAYLNIRDIYLEFGNRKEADKYDLKALRIMEKMMAENRLARMVDIQFLNDLQTAQEETRKISLQSERRWKMLLTLGIIFAIALFVVFLQYANIRRIRRKNKMLYQQSVEALRVDEENRALLSGYRKEIDELRNQATASQQTAAKSVEENADEPDPEKRTYRGSHLTEEEKKSIYEKILMVLEDTDKICSPEFSLASLVEDIGSKSRYVSQTISECSGKNFSTLLSDRRVKEACRRLNNPTRYGQLTIEAIALSVGFKSRSSFITAFKRSVGLTPSEYLKLCRAKAAHGGAYEAIN